MLIKNEDIQDGLVNGVMGTVMQIGSHSGSNSSLPEVIFIKFDNENVGKNAKLQKIINQKRCVGLHPSSEDIPLKNGVRKQFPLRLAWACTVHKVQGLTVKECVVDLNRCFAHGQAYVALSRVTSVDGLYLNQIDSEKLDKKIHCDPDIEEGMSAMESYLPVQSHQRKSDQCIKILYQYIQGLQQHLEDLKHNEDFKDADWICLTETWVGSDSDLTEMEHFEASHIKRSTSFDASCSLYKELAELQHGGVSVFYRTGILYEEIKQMARNLECIVFKLIHIDTLVAVVYRPQKYIIGKFMEIFSSLINQMEILSDRLIVIGDFNQDILTNQKTVLEFMSSKGFNQHIAESTTENGTLIDHVYVKGCPHVEKVSVVPTYYSYHEAIVVYVDIDV